MSNYIVAAYKKRFATSGSCLNTELCDTNILTNR